MIDFNNYIPLSFSTCLNPTIVYRDGDPVVCRCGKCDSCVQARRSHTSIMLDREIKNWNYCVFFTLTYSPEFCPSVKLVRDSSVVNQWNFLLLGRTKSLLSNSKYIPYCININEDNQYIVTYVDSDGVISLKEILPIKFIPYLNNPKFKDSFGILCYRDIQLWRKRFLKSYFNYVKKYYPSVFANGTPKYRLFYVGEYGTRSYRPHFLSSTEKI